MVVELQARGLPSQWPQEALNIFDFQSGLGGERPVYEFTLDF